MENHREEKEPLIAQSRAGEAGANLTDVLAANKRDAERYRWLRDRGVEDAAPGKWLVVYEGLSDHSLLPDELDAAIDSAMAANAD